MKGLEPSTFCMASGSWGSVPTHREGAWLSGKAASSLAARFRMNRRRLQAIPGVLGTSSALVPKGATPPSRPRKGP